MKSWEVRLVSYDHSGVLCCLLEVRGIDSPPNQSGWYQGLWGSWQEDLGNCKYWSSLETQRAEQTKIRLDLTWFLWLFTPNNLKFRSFFFFFGFIFISVPGIHTQWWHFLRLLHKPASKNPFYQTPSLPYIIFPLNSSQSCLSAHSIFQKLLAKTNTLAPRIPKLMVNLLP